MENPMSQLAVDTSNSKEGTIRVFNKYILSKLKDLSIKLKEEKRRFLYGEYNFHHDVFIDMKPVDYIEEGIKPYLKHIDDENYFIVVIFETFVNSRGFVYYEFTFSDAEAGLIPNEYTPTPPRTASVPLLFQDNTLFDYFITLDRTTITPEIAKEEELLIIDINTCRMQTRLIRMSKEKYLTCLVLQLTPQNVVDKIRRDLDYNDCYSIVVQRTFYLELYPVVVRCIKDSNDYIYTLA